MKISIFTLPVVLLLLFASGAGAQTVSGVPVSDIDVDYVEIVGTSKVLSSKMSIKIDFGQHDKALVSKDTRIMDASGREMKFNSMIDALNFMSEHGYEFVNAYVVTESADTVYHYLLRKKPARQE